MLPSIFTDSNSIEDQGSILQIPQCVPTGTANQSNPTPCININTSSWSSIHYYEFNERLGEGRVRN